MTNLISSLYLHVPFCRHLCNYCDFYKKKLEDSDTQFNEFENYLTQSWQRHQQWMEQEKLGWARHWESIYLGGGTPSLWGSRGAEFLQKMLPAVTVDEWTLEVDPGTWNEEMLTSWRDLGVNRLSIGTQSLDPVFLKILDRAHSIDDSYLLLEKARGSGINYSFDFLLGVPHSSTHKRNVIKELEHFLRFDPHHVSLYILNARAKYPLTEFMPDDDYIAHEYLEVCDFLQEKGFFQYEVSNFARAGFESKHNMKYWDSQSVAALGPTGTGLIKFDDKTAKRYKWKPSRADFEVELLGATELELERLYLELRTRRGWEPRESQKSEKLEAKLQDWQLRGLTSAITPRVVMKPQGLVILDSLINELFQIEV